MSHPLRPHHRARAPTRAASADFYSEVLGLPPAREEAPFLAVDLGNDVALCFAGWDRTVAPQHYAFLVSESDFDDVLGRLHAARPGLLGRRAREAVRARSTTTTAGVASTSATLTVTGSR